MGARMRAHDWSGTPLGAPETWPQSLRPIVGLMLVARQAMFLAWGPELTFLYNDAYAPALGAKHPRALGRPLAEVWSDVWAQIGPLVERNLAGEGVYFEDLRVPMERSGYPEEAWFTFSYTPVRDESGAVAGIFCAGVETTERVRAELALHDSEARLEAAIKLVGLSPYAWNPVTGELWWDARLKALFGLPPNALANHEVWLSALHPEDRPRVEAAAAASLDPSGDGVYKVEYRIIGIADGIEHWLSAFGLTSFEGGRAVGHTGAVIEITERKRAEQALRESEARYRALAEAVPQIVWSNTADGANDYFNSRWFAYTGLAEEEGYARGWEGIIHPDDLSRTLEIWNRALRAGDAVEVEYRLRRADGCYRWHLGRAVPARDGEGRVVRWYGTATDIHDRKMAEEALQESEERFRRFTENSTDVLWIFDVEANQLEYLSPAYERVRGEPRDAMLRDWSRWTETLHPDDRERAVGALERVLQGETVVSEYRIVRADGVVRWIRDTAFPIRDEQGKVRRVGGIAQDVTRHEGALVYMVDGDEGTRQSLTSVLLGAGYDVKTFAAVRAFLEAAPALLPGCVVVDTRAPGAGGLAVPRELKARRIELPVIVVGECRGDVSVAVRAMKAGAVDYLEAPCSLEALLSAVASALADIQDAAARDRSLELARARIAEMSAREREVLHRLLTGAPTRRSRATSASARARSRSTGPTSWSGSARAPCPKPY